MTDFSVSSSISHLVTKQNPMRNCAPAGACGYLRSRNPINILLMKTKFYLRVVEFDERKGEFVADYDKSITYDLDDPTDQKALAQRAIELLVDGAELKLYSIVDRSSLAKKINLFDDEEA